MNAWTKKVRKHSAGDLTAAEEYLAATYVEPPGVIGRTVAFGAIGGVAGLAVGKKLKDREATKAEETGSTQGIAETIPHQKGVLALTGQRLMMFEFGAMMGRPKELVWETPRATIASTTFEMGKMLGTTTITFTDGSAVAFETAKAAKPAFLAEALGAQI